MSNIESPGGLTARRISGGEMICARCGKSNRNTLCSSYVTFAGANFLDCCFDALDKEFIVEMPAIINRYSQYADDLYKKAENAKKLLAEAVDVFKKVEKSVLKNDYYDENVTRSGGLQPPPVGNSRTGPIREQSAETYNGDKPSRGN